MKPLFLRLLLPLLCAGCAPTVQVAVPKPVVIDVNMKVDVTSREVKAPAATPSATDSSSPSKPTPTQTPDAAVTAHEDLTREVGSLKNSFLVGENNKGYLEVRKLPAGKLPSGEGYADYVKRIVGEENEARKTLYMEAAQKDGVPVDKTAADAAKRLQDNAYAGQWYQDDSGAWKQK